MRDDIGSDRKQKIMVQILFTCKDEVGKEPNKEGEEGKGRKTPCKGNSPGGRQGEGEAVRYEFVIVIQL